MSQRQNDYSLGAIQEIVRRETVYLRHYYAKVFSNIDTLKKGRIQVTIDQLGIVAPNYITCSPRQGNSLTIPNINDFVEVYFMNGRADFAVYLYPATEMENMNNKAATADPFMDIIYANPDNKEDVITYHRKTRLMKILNLIGLGQITPKINFLQGTEPFVLGTQLNTYLANFINNTFNTHTHPTAGTGPPSVPTVPGTAPSGILSTEIMGK